MTRKHVLRFFECFTGTIFFIRKFYKGYNETPSIKGMIHMTKLAKVKRFVRENELAITIGVVTVATVAMHVYVTKLKNELDAKEA